MMLLFVLFKVVKFSLSKIVPLIEDVGIEEVGRHSSIEIIEIIGIIIGIVAGIGTLYYYFVDIRFKKKDHSDSQNHDNKKSFIRFSMCVVRKSVKNIVNQIDQDQFVPTIIIGIGRGGGIFGSFISYDLYHTPLVVVDRDYDWRTGKRNDNILFDFEIPAYLIDKVLLVAGEAHTGGTIELFQNYLISLGAGEIKTCVFYKQSVCTINIDYYGKEGEGVPLMPWQNNNYIRDSINKKNSDLLQELRPIHKLEGKTIYIIRHGETDNNKRDVFIGITESALNNTGKNQINSVAKYLLRTECITTSSNVSIYSSPQKRAVESASIIAREIGFEEDFVKKCKSLRERNYGKWEGMERKDIIQKYPNEYSWYEKDPLHSVPPSGDKLISIIQNSQKIIDIIAKDSSKIIIIVTHKTIGRILSAYFCKTYFSMYRDIPFDNGGISKFNVVNGKICTSYLNKTF